MPLTSSDGSVLIGVHSALLGAWFLRRLWRLRGLAELRIRLFEALAAAARRGVPLGPLLERASEERRGAVRAALVRLAEDVENGVPLSDALAACRALRVSRVHAAAIRAADGTPQIADALDAVGRDETAARARRHRTWGVAAYPLLIIALSLLLVRTCGERLQGVFESVDIAPVGAWWMDIRLPSFLHGEGFGWTLIAATAVYVAYRFLRAWGAPGARFIPTWSLLGEIPPFRGASRVAGAAAFLDALAGQLRGGRPLPLAARAAATATRNRGVRRGALRLATAVEHGESASDAWDLVPVPASVRPRAALALARADAPVALERLAAECRGRCDLAVERRMRWLEPLGIAVAAVIAGSMVYSLAASYSAVIGLGYGARPWSW